MKYPIGIQSFDQIREDGYVYVDKESYKIRIDILEDALRSESLNVPQIITDIINH